jgi:hypothetical protein
MAQPTDLSGQTQQIETELTVIDFQCSMAVFEVNQSHGLQTWRINPS